MTHALTSIFQGFFLLINKRILFCISDYFETPTHRLTILHPTLPYALKNRDWVKRVNQIILITIAKVNKCSIQPIGKEK